MIKLIKKYQVICIIIGFILINVALMAFQQKSEPSLQIKSSNEVETSGQSMNTPALQQNNMLELEDEEENLIVDDEAEIKSEQSESEPILPTELQIASVDSEVPVYICGEIMKPGVYYVSSNAIINDVIELSGGFTQDADRTFVNLASPIAGYQKIVIPKLGEEIDKIADSYDNIKESQENLNLNLDEGINTQSSLININFASLNELMTLNGIGETKAQAIINYRETVSPFKQVEDIKNVSGIGEKTFEKIKLQITT